MKRASAPSVAPVFDPEHTPYDLFARGLLYSTASRDEQKRFALDLKSALPQATYAPELLANIYNMTHTMVQDWNYISALTTPWIEKNSDERVAHLQHVLDHYDRTHKKDCFIRPLPTRIKVLPREQAQCLMGTVRTPDCDLIVVTPEALAFDDESWIMSSTGHETFHLQVIDFHETTDDVFTKTCNAALDNVDAHIDEVIHQQGALGYDLEWRMAASYITQHVATVDNLSSAHVCEKTMKESAKSDGRFNWYKRSPEESMVRLTQLYASLLFNKEKNISNDDALFMALMDDKEYVGNSASHQMYQYIENHAPFDKTMTALLI